MVFQDAGKWNVHAKNENACFLDFSCVLYFYGFLTWQENAKQNEKTKQEIKEKVRGMYLSTTSGWRCWFRSYVAGAVGSAGSTGAVDGSAGSTRATRVEGNIDLDGAVIGFAVDAAVASPSVPRVNWER